MLCFTILGVVAEREFMMLFRGVILSLHWLEIFCRAVAASLARTGSCKPCNTTYSHHTIIILTCSK